MNKFNLVLVFRNFLFQEFQSILNKPRLNPVSIRLDLAKALSHQESITRKPAAMPFFFEIMLWIFAGMILLHVYGAIRKAQPITETLEITVWILLSLVTLGFYPL